MKFATLAVVAVATIGAIGAVATADQLNVMAPAEALDVVEGSAVPEGVTFTGHVEKIEDSAVDTAQEAADENSSLEFFGGPGLWGGFGPYRFGFMRGGFPGWAYPLPYWNRFGAGLFGGGCGFGVPFGGLYYC